MLEVGTKERIFGARSMVPVAESLMNMYYWFNVRHTTLEAYIPLTPFKDFERQEFSPPLPVCTKSMAQLSNPILSLQFALKQMDKHKLVSWWEAAFLYPGVIWVKFSNLIAPSPYYGGLTELLFPAQPVQTEPKQNLTERAAARTFLVGSSAYLSVNAWLLRSQSRQIDSP